MVFRGPEVCSGPMQRSEVVEVVSKYIASNQRSRLIFSQYRAGDCAKVFCANREQISTLDYCEQQAKLGRGTEGEL
jgi:hypothetical protein